MSYQYQSPHVNVNVNVKCKCIKITALNWYISISNHLKIISWIKQTFYNLTF